MPAGSHFVGMRLRANLHEADWAEEHIGGISYMRFLRELADGFETSWPTLKTAMERIRSFLLDRGALLCNVTTDAASWRRFEPELASFLNTLPYPRIRSRSLRGALAKDLASRPWQSLRASIMSARAATFIAWASGRAVRPMLSSSIFVRAGCGIRSAFRAGRMVAFVRSIIARAILPSCHTATPICSKRSTSMTKPRAF